MINLDQMEREARARLARKLSVSVAYHMRALNNWRLPPDVVLCQRLPGECWHVTYSPIGERTSRKIEDRGPQRLEMVVAINGLTHRQVRVRNVHNFERLGVPGVWLLHSTRMGMTIARCYFEEVAA